MVVLFLLLIFFILFLNGYILTLLFKWVDNFFVRIAVSFLFPVVLLVIFTTVLVVLNMPPAFSLVFLFLISLIVFLKKKKDVFVIFDEWGEVSQKERVIFVFIFLFSLGAALLTFASHFSYRWPIHADEWWSVASVQKLMEGRTIDTHPYFLDAPFFTDKFIDWKVGFSGFWAGVFQFFNINPLNAWVFLPALNVFLFSFVLSVLILKYIHSSFVSFLPVLIVSLRSDTYVLGWWFFTPFVFSFFLIIPLLILAKEWFFSKSGLLFGALVLGASALIYFPFAVLTGLSLIVFFWKWFKNRQRLFVLFFLVFITLSVFFLTKNVNPIRSFWGGENGANVLTNTAFYKFFMVPFNLDKTEPTGMELVGKILSVPFLIALFLGILSSMRKLYLEPLIIASFFSFFFVIFAFIFHMSFFTFPQRFLYFFGVVSTPLALQGFFAFANLFASKTGLGIRRHIFFVILGIIFSFFAFRNYFDPLLDISKSSLYWLVEKKDLPAISWLKSNEEFKKMAILTDPPLGTIITPLTRIPAKISFLTLENSNKLYLDNLKPFIFHLKSCDDLGKIMRELGTELFYSPLPKKCSFLKEVFKSEGAYVYFYPMSN